MYINDSRRAAQRARRLAMHRLQLEGSMHGQTPLIRLMNLERVALSRPRKDMSLSVFVENAGIRDRLAEIFRKFEREFPPDRRTTVTDVNAFMGEGLLALQKAVGTQRLGVIHANTLTPEMSDYVEQRLQPIYGESLIRTIGSPLDIPSVASSLVDVALVVFTLDLVPTEHRKAFIEAVTKVVREGGSIIVIQNLFSFPSPPLDGAFVELHQSLTHQTSEEELRSLLTNQGRKLAAFVEKTVVNLPVNEITCAMGNTSIAASIFQKLAPST